jgi:predicted Zn-dependent protease
MRGDSGRPVGRPMATRTRRWRSAIALILAASLALPPGAFAKKSGGGERDLGRRFLLEARSQLPITEDPALAEYIEQLGGRLVKALGPQEFDYRFFVVQSPILNAFAVPGGYVFLFTGLIARANTEDEIVGVLGHEIGHVHAHHIVRLQQAGTMWTVASLVGMLLAAVNPVLAAGALAAAQTAQLKYSRDFEQEADYLGLRTATDAGYDPQALTAFFKQLLVEQRVNPTGVPPYMLSHPITEERVANADSVIRSRGLKTPPGRPKASPQFLEAKAVAAALDGPPDAVVAQYRRLAEERPDDAERQFLLGRVYQTVGRLDPARTALERARDLGYGPGVDRPLGAVYVNLKQPEKGTALLQAYLATAPSDGWAHLELGKALADQGKGEDAQREYQRALRLDDDLDEAHRLLGMSLGRTGDQAQGFYQLGTAALLRGDLEQAFSLYDRARPLLAEGTAERAEVDAALDELEPLVRDRIRERATQNRPRGAAPGP